MKRALVLGDNASPRHPLYRVMPSLNRALEGAFVLETKEDYGALSLEQAKDYELIINYADDWDGRGTRSAAAALVAYVADGGSYLALHCGLATPRCDELSLMTGARFLGYPSQILMDFSPGKDPHPISQWTYPFKVTEEPYRFEFDVFRDSQKLLQYRYGYRWYPAAWCHDYLLGRVFCLIPGHSAESYIPPVRQLLYKAGLWLTHRL